MARVFVSHASHDLELADRVHRWLLDDGHQVFLDRSMTDGILPGDEWERRLHERLRWADAVTCLVTSAFVRSPWCTGEVAVARSRGCRLIPLRAEPEAVHPLLGAVQHIDWRHGPQAVRTALTRALQLVDATGGTGWPDGRSPFPGLRAFATDQHRVFFGRAVEVNEIGGLLRSPAEDDTAALLVVGPSGCGKSSLVRAGLLPLMASEPGWWTLSPVLPGSDPEAALVRELAAAFRMVGVGTGIAELRTRLDMGGLSVLVDELLHAAPGPRRQRLLLVIDQFEELLTQSSPDQRARFAALLRPAVQGSLRVVGTLRPEFLDPLLVSPELAGLSTRTYTVRPLGRAALASVIEGPARLAGIAIDPDLVGRLVADTDDGAALPLLAYTLAQLAEGVGRGDRLQLARYVQLGGVRGTLTRQADAALAAAETAGGRGREMILRDLLRLVTVDEHGRPTRCRVPAAELPGAELEPFVTRRLLVTDNDGGDAVVQVAHEAILTAWGPLARAVEANASALRAQRRIEQAAQEWKTDGRQPRRLWDGDQLAAALADVGAHTQAAARSSGLARRRRLVGTRVALSRDALDFLTVSRRRDRRQRARSLTVLALLLVAALVAAGVATVQLRSSEEQRRIATGRLLLSRAEAALSSDPRTALRLAEASQHLNPDPETRSVLAGMLHSTGYAGTLPQTDTVRDLAYTADSAGLAAAGVDGRVQLWDLADPERPRPAGVLDGSTVAISPIGRLAATGDAQGAIRLWDVADLHQPRQVGNRLTGHTDVVRSLAFSPDGHTLASASADHTAALWDVATPERARRIGGSATGHTDALSMIEVAADGRTVVTAGEDSTVRLWNLTTAGGLRPLGEPLPGLYGTAAFVGNGTVLAARDRAGIGLWALANRQRPRRLATITGRVGQGTALTASPDGHTLAIGGSDGVVELWNVTDPAHPTQLGDPLAGHSQSVLTVAFRPDGHGLASGSADRAVQLWNLVGAFAGQAVPVGPPLSGYAGPVVGLAYTPDGRTLTTGSSDGTTVLWNLAEPAAPHRLGAPLSVGDFVVGIGLSPDGRTLATAGGPHELLLWDITDPVAPRPLGGPLPGYTKAVNAAKFTPDGHTLAAGGVDGTVLLWDVTEPARPRQLGGPLVASDRGIFFLAVAADGRTMAVTTLNGSLKLWSIVDPTRPVRLSEPIPGPGVPNIAVGFAPDGHILATGSADGTVTLWNVTDPTTPQRLGGPLTGHTTAVYTVAFAPDGRTVATGSNDGTVRLWDLTDQARPQPLAPPLTGHAGAGVTALAFAPDGRSLATGGRDNSVRIYDITGLLALRDQALQRACALTGGGLDRDAWQRLVPGLPFEDSCPAP